MQEVESETREESGPDNREVLIWLQQMSGYQQGMNGKLDEILEVVRAAKSNTMVRKFLGLKEESRV